MWEIKLNYLNLTDLENDSGSDETPNVLKHSNEKSVMDEVLFFFPLKILVYYMVSSVLWYYLWQKAWYF